MTYADTLEAPTEGKCLFHMHTITLLVRHLIVALFAACSVYADVNEKCSSEWKKCPREKKGYYYDETSDKCVLYTNTKDCGLNRHLFPSEEECTWECRTDTICNMPLEKGQKCDKSGELMYYYDPTKMECDLFFYKGCDGNANRFVSVRECEVTCRGKRCILPMNDDPDICDQRRLTYHFYGKDGVSSCISKTNGCYRSGHNFKSGSDCRRVCILSTTASGECKPYRGFHSVSAGDGTPWYCYNKTAKVCVPGKVARRDGRNYRTCFPWPEMCAWYCVSPNVCFLPKDVGDSTCEGTKKLMYYFNKDSQTCELFLYYGCNGNQNRFEEMRQCEVTCKGPTCTTAPRVSPEYCDIPREERVEMYRYNMYTGSCTKDISCNRDGSNYKRQRDCEQRCLFKKKQ